MQAFGSDDPSLRAVLREAWRLVGRPHHSGLRPGGVVITPGPLTDVAPLLLSPKGFLAVQYEHGDAEAIGLPKLDFLGIRALTVLADALNLTGGRSEASVGQIASGAHLSGLESIPDDDPATAAMLSAGETIGVFQCESDGARRTLRQLRARNVANLAFDGTVQYYMTSATDLDGAAGTGQVEGDEGAGLLFFDANLDGSVDGVVLLLGVTRTTFQADDIVA